MSATPEQQRAAAPRPPPGGTAVRAGSPAPPTGRGPRATGTLYRGGAGMWSWVAQRICGVVLFFFLLVHVLDTALVRVSPEAYNAVIQTYKNPVVGLMEVGLVGAFLFHALNGIRIVLIDFWSFGPRVQLPMLYGVLGLWVIHMIPFTLRHVGFVLS